MSAMEPCQGRVVEGLLVAPLVAGTVVGFVAAVLVGPLAIPFAVFGAAVIGWPVAFVLGIPAHLLLRRWRVASLPAYAVAGLPLGLAPMMATELARIVGCAVRHTPACGVATISYGDLFAVGASGALGIVAGAVFWWIVRPDRALPPAMPSALPEIFP